MYFENYNQLFTTQSYTPSEAYKKWFEGSRGHYAWLAGIAFLGRRLIKWSPSKTLADRCCELIGHDRYLLKVDSRLPGGKGSM